MSQQYNSVCRKRRSIMSLLLGIFFGFIFTCCVQIVNGKFASCAQAAMFHAFEKVQMDLVRQSLQDGPLGKLLGKSSAKTAVFNNKLLKFGKAYQQFIPLGEFLPLQTPMSLLSSPHSSRHFQSISAISGGHSIAGLWLYSSVHFAAS